MSNTRTIYQHELDQLISGTKLICVSSYDPLFYLLGEVYEVKESYPDSIMLEDEYSKSGMFDEGRDTEFHHWNKAILADWSWGCRFEVILD